MKKYLQKIFIKNTSTTNDKRPSAKYQTFLQTPRLAQMINSIATLPSHHHCHLISHLYKGESSTWIFGKNWDFVPTSLTNVAEVMYFLKCILSKVNFCEMYPTCVSYKLCEFIYHLFSSKLQYW